MSELIKREDAIEAMAELQGIAQSKAELTGISKAWKRIKALPTVDAVPVDFIKALHTDYVKRSKALQGRTGYMYTLYAIALENLVQSFDYDNAMADEMKTERNCADVERKI